MMKSVQKRICRFLTAGLLLILLGLAGCQPTIRGQGDYMAIGFQPDTTLRYRFVSSRDVEILLTTGVGGKKEDSKVSRESLELVMEIKPLQIDPYELTTLEFTCLSAQVKRTSFSGKGAATDAMEFLKGKSYTIQITPTGQLENINSFRDLVREIGQKSFVSGADAKKNIKNPDMILDWIFFQYSLWDVTASNTKALSGIKPGSSWQSEQFLPWPTPTRNVPSRITTYTVKEIKEQDMERIAVIDSTYQLREKPVLTFPPPYTGSFQTKGSLFSVLRNYRHESIEGSGTQVFNLTEGVLESDRQEYTLVTRADFIMPLGQSLPTLTVRQTISIERLDKNPAKGETGGT